MPDHPLVAADSERALIGAMLAGVSLGTRDATDSLFRDMDAADFGLPPHRCIWRAMAELASEDVEPTPAAVVARLADFGAGEHAPLVHRLVALDDAGLPNHHAGVVRDRAARRRILLAARTVEERSVDLETPLAELVDAAERTIFSATIAKATAPLVPQPIKRHLMDVVGLIESGGYKGTPTGYYDLDSMLTGGGVLAGQLIVVAGATAMGKTALATGVAAHVGIESGRPALYCSIEMTAMDNALRLLCHEARVDLKAVSEGHAGESDMVQIIEATALLERSRIFLHDGATTVNQVRSAARRLRAEVGDLGLIVVDHIQDMEGPGDNRREQIGGIARSLKALAKELGCAIIAVSQLRRIQGKTDHTPTLSDLKESGDVENSADTVWLLYRPEYYHGPTDPNGNDIRNQAKLIVAKQRNGRSGVVPLTWIPASVRFDNADRRHVRVA